MVTRAFNVDIPTGRYYNIDTRRLQAVFTSTLFKDKVYIVLSLLVTL